MKRFLLHFFSHRTLALIRWDIHFMGVRLKNFFFRKKSVISEFLKSKESKYLNLGSGPRGLDNSKWLNIDGYPDTNVHYCCDFSRPLPIPENSFDGIFTEHVIEHFDYDTGKKVLDECRRILKPGGIIRIIVPDGKLILRSYFDDPQKIIEYKHCLTGQPMEAVNKWFYQRYEHQCIYDAEYLIGLLHDIGFARASETSYGVSSFQDMSIVLDDQKYLWESLYVEAVK